jgi:hypothetical protein
MEIIPNQNKVAKPVFKSPEEYEKFVIKFHKKLDKQLKKLNDARRRSESEIEAYLPRYF